MLQKHFHLQESSINTWPFWMFEENIKLVNEIIEEEENKQKKQEENQSNSMGNFDANSMIKNAQNMTNKFKSPKF